MAKGVAGCIGKKGAAGCAGAKGWGGCKQGIMCGECEYSVGDTIELAPPTWELQSDDTQWSCQEGNIGGPDPSAVWDTYNPARLIAEVLSGMPAKWPFTITAITPTGGGNYSYTLVYSGTWPTMLGVGATGGGGTMGASWYTAISGHSGYFAAVDLTISLTMYCDATSPPDVLHVGYDDFEILVTGSLTWTTGDPPPFDIAGCGGGILVKAAEVQIDEAAECRALHNITWSVISGEAGGYYERDIDVTNTAGTVQVLP